MSNSNTNVSNVSGKKRKSDDANHEPAKKQNATNAKEMKETKEMKDMKDDGYGPAFALDLASSQVHVFDRYAHNQGFSITNDSNGVPILTMEQIDVLWRLKAIKYIRYMLDVILRQHLQQATNEEQSNEDDDDREDPNCRISKVIRDGLQPMMTLLSFTVIIRKPKNGKMPDGGYFAHYGSMVFHGKLTYPLEMQQKNNNRQIDSMINIETRQIAYLDKLLQYASHYPEPVVDFLRSVRHFEAPQSDFLHPYTILDMDLTSLRSYFTCSRIHNNNNSSNNE